VRRTGGPENFQSSVKKHFLIQLIREKSIANPLWGALRIHGELLKLGIEISQTCVYRKSDSAILMVKAAKDRS
jgi:hypothetical protein